jgi:hypothetical protein
MSYVSQIALSNLAIFCIINHVLKSCDCWKFARSPKTQDLEEEIMGPQILLDKSTLQSLSKDEIILLNKHYYLVAAPTLIIEILGDLKKYTSNIEKSKNEVRTLAYKIQRTIDSTITANCRILLEGNLLGYLDVIMDGRPIRVDGIPIIDKLGRKGMYLEEQPENTAIREWVEGNFSEAELALADLWRKSTKSINLEKYRKLYKGNPKFDNWNSLLAFISNICNRTNIQFELLSFLIDDLEINFDAKNAVFDRWLNRGMPIIKDFSPYAYYCLNVLLSFYTGIANGFIGTRSTNRVDLEYVLYIPFCKVFSSSDKFLIDFAKLFLKEDQDFIDGLSLKNDLKTISAHWDGLTAEEKKEYRKNYGFYPPDLPDSFTNYVWKKHMRPREEYEHIEMTPEREKEILEHLRPMMEAIDERKKYRI